MPISQRDLPRDLTHSDGEDDSQIGSDSDQGSAGGSSEESMADDEPDNEVDHTPKAAREQISNVSFGALKQAHDTLSRKRKRQQDNSEDQEAKLALLRERLQRIKQEKPGKDGQTRGGQAVKNGRHPATASVVAGDNTDSESNEDTSGDDTGTQRSKHAPAMQSSKRQVTRRRQVIDIPKRTTRDPRFDAVRQSPYATTGHEEKAYGFLRDYQKSEMQELKSAIKATRSEEDKETLRRKLNSMENQVKAREARDREKDIVRKHRREEREQAQQGKTPFYLKRGEIKQRALVEKFQGMKGKDREKLLERRRRKESQKEKKRMPNLRRMPA